MKKDIPNFKVEDIGIAIVPPTNGSKHDELWDCILINMKDTVIKDVLIASTGYGHSNGEDCKTTTLRHFYDEVGPLQVINIEPIQKKLFTLTNEFWISFNLNGNRYDKKYIFVEGSISEVNFTAIPLVGRKGVLII